MEVVKEKKQQKAIYTKKPKMGDKVGKYLVARKSGKNKEEARDIANYSKNTRPQTIEASKSYEALEQRYYKDELQAEITSQEVAKAHAENIKQDKDRGARNKAIEMYKTYTEPNEAEQDREDIVIVLKAKTTTHKG
jgi:hypothetical protein